MLGKLKAVAKVECHSTAKDQSVLEVSDILSSAQSRMGSGVAKHGYADAAFYISVILCDVAQSYDVPPPGET